MPAFLVSSSSSSSSPATDPGVSTVRWEVRKTEHTCFLSFLLSQCVSLLSLSLCLSVSLCLSLCVCVSLSLSVCLSICLSLTTVALAHHVSLSVYACTIARTAVRHVQLDLTLLPLFINKDKPLVLTFSSWSSLSVCLPLFLFLLSPSFHPHSFHLSVG